MSAKATGSSNTSSRVSQRNPRGGHGHQGNANDVPTFNKRGGQNINHLLSFTLPPRSRPPPSTSRKSRRAGGSVPFNKERYVNAQYRFLVKPTGDYTAHFADPDIYLHWPDILQVLIPTTSALSAASSSSLPPQGSHEGAACPICLSPPTAPRMTKCGHVFCYPCILHYLTLADTDAAPGASSRPSAPSQKWRRCPICWDAVYARDLKAVKWWDPRAVALEHEEKVAREQAASAAQGEGFHAAESSAATLPNGPRQKGAETLTLRLIERPHVTTLALPQSSTWPSSSLDHPLIAPHSAPWHFLPDVMGFSKFMLATPTLLIESLTNDLAELEAEIQTLKSFGTDELGLEFIDLAEKKVREQIVKVQTELDTPLVQSTIGQARNDMKELEAAESGRRTRMDEALSRRQRKKLEKALACAEPPSAVKSEEKEGEGEEEDQDHGGAPEVNDGVTDFLALKSRSQGGVTSRRSNGGLQASEDALTAAAAAATNKSSTRTVKQRKNVNPPAPNLSAYLFFQASSGQNIFLHPLDIKILLSHFGSYSAFPRTLQVVVGGADEGSMNEELRRRCKYLGHLPTAADVVFVEVDWEKMDVMAKSTLGAYEQALRQRKSKRREKSRREDRARSKADEAEYRSTTAGGMQQSNARRRAQEVQDLLLSPSSPPRTHLAGVGEGDLLSTSFESSSTTAGAEAVSEASLGGTGNRPRSPSFREAALWGSEREFPIHPGGGRDAEEDFPDCLGGGEGGGKGSHVEAGGGSKTFTRTVWGTQAPTNTTRRSASFADALHSNTRSGGGRRGGGQAAEDWNDESVDDAWHELEEDFILGSSSFSTSSIGRRANSNKNSKPPAGAGSNQRQGGGGEVVSISGHGEGNQKVEINEGQQNNKKNKKKMLILTAGGGGRGTR
ncbi:hypothetical protein IE53DRAFT_320381 [Violaceomyces palustris]|uniref:Uncharacterized protein n=1 Tax=Violaceomyces palustris TaxID=1673888 RepID=A0ACD0NQ41_9BASI|nr:hypothetical protein IE53DRAFT_320381 [Violaceomyces palustris]